MAHPAPDFTQRRKGTAKAAKNFARHEVTRHRGFRAGRRHAVDTARRGLACLGWPLSRLAR